MTTQGNDASGHNTQIGPYLVGNTELKDHQLELLSVLRQYGPSAPSSLLDIGCAAGVMLSALHDLFPDANLSGLDISEELIAIADASIGHYATLVCDDAVTWAAESTFDLIIASGVLSIWEDFRLPLERWLSWLTDQGVLVIFGRFNSQKVDTIIRFKLESSNEWQGGLTAYSIATVSKYLDSQGCTYSWIPFHLGRDLPIPTDPITTYTVRTNDGQRLVLSGANIIAEHYFLVVHH